MRFQKSNRHSNYKRYTKDPKILPVLLNFKNVIQLKTINRLERRIQYFRSVEQLKSLIGNAVGLMVMVIGGPLTGHRERAGLIYEWVRGMNRGKWF